jgi:hypothetical protein
MTDRARLSYDFSTEYSEAALPVSDRLLLVDYQVPFY